MQPLIRFALAVLFILPGLALAEQSPERQAVEQYVARTGIEQVMAAVPEQIDAMAQQQAFSPDAQQAENHIVQALLHSWDTQAMTDAVIDHIAANTNNEEMQRLLQWSASPLAQRFYAAELATSEASFEQDFLQFMAGQETWVADPEKDAAIERLVEATAMADMMTEMTIQIMQAVISSLVSADEETAAIVEPELAAMVEQYREQLQPAMEQQAILVSQFLYRDISVQDIDLYSAHYESALGQREATLVSQSIIAAMSLWAGQAGTAISQLGLFDEPAEDENACGAPAE